MVYTDLEAFVHHDFIRNIIIVSEFYKLFSMKYTLFSIKVYSSYNHCAIMQIYFSRITECFKPV